MIKKTTPDTDIQDCLKQSIQKVETFVEEATGRKATHQEIADALSRYFVLNEILEFIKMSRED